MLYPCHRELHYYLGFEILAYSEMRLSRDVSFEPATYFQRPKRNVAGPTPLRARAQVRQSDSFA